MENSLQFISGIKLSLIFNSYAVVGNWWSFNDVVSPFSRIYLVTEGEGWVFTDRKKLHLTPGKLCIIPKFTRHSYCCEEKMGQYYICFFDEMYEGMDMFDFFDFKDLTDAQADDERLFRRINELNSHGNIINPDPSIFEQRETISSYLKRTSTNNLSALIEIQGILLQLVSRFIDDDSVSTRDSVLHKNRFKQILTYIDQNMGRKITLKELASQLFLSEDYFSKIFHDSIGLRPIEYINQKRIEKAQMLLVTTALSIAEVAEKVGISNNAYFSTIFKKHTLQTPEEYKKSYRWL